ncbi:hypothetical protein [Zobellia uliginosa]|uniref:hypothetical protein n=1 Tax=Zobellia uliginosa TaxID=143224 RepID=UPI001C07766A|nr:hypothetical protein [Zobellia uliginosa]MBU2945782.1 hypothetical protein [Zobellia uliginosa]
MKIKKIIGLIIMILIYNNCMSQNKEYIVTFDNDTIYGKVKRRTDLGGPKLTQFHYKFKEDNKKYRPIKPSEVKFFHTIDGVDGDAFFVSRDKHFFLERIVDGEIRLFKSVVSLANEKPSYYYIKNNSILRSTSIGTSRKKSHGQIRTLLEDKPKILQEFETLKGSLDNIKYIIEKYNNAKN